MRNPTVEPARNQLRHAVPGAVPRGDADYSHGRAGPEFDIQRLVGPWLRLQRHTRREPHVHGELFKARSTLDQSLVYALSGDEIRLGDTCEKGSQLRPHIVWFGEAVQNYDGQRGASVAGVPHLQREGEGMQRFDQGINAPARRVLEAERPGELEQDATETPRFGERPHGGAKRVEFARAVQRSCVLMSSPLIWSVM